MKFRTMYKAAAVLLSLALITGCAAFSGPDEANGEEEARVLVPVDILRVTPQTILNELTYAAQLTPVRQAMVMPRMQGLVSATFADVGDRVNEGDILFTLDERDVQNQIRALQAQHSQAVSGIAAAQNALVTATGGQFETQLMQVDSTIENLEMQLEANDVTLQNATITYNSAADNYSNISILYQAGAAARSAYDQARTAYDQAANALEQVRIARDQIVLSLEQAGRNRGLLTEQIAGESRQSAAIGVTTAESAANVVAVQLANATSTLSDLSVRSPISGVVNVKNARTDEFATMASPAFVIIDTSSLNVEVRVSEIIINHINVGDTVDIVVSSFSPYPIQGTVRTVSPGVDHTNTFGVTIEIENTDETLRPGMFAEVRFVREAAHDAIVVPVNAVLRSIDGSQFVYILAPGNIAEQVHVTTGISNGREIEILSGLSVNDEVIVRGQTNVVGGEEVNVIARN